MLIIRHGMVKDWFLMINPFSGQFLKEIFFPSLNGMGIS